MNRVDLELHPCFNPKRAPTDKDHKGGGDPIINKFREAG